MVIHAAHVCSCSKWPTMQHCGAKVKTVTSRVLVWIWGPPAAFLCEVCMFCLCVGCFSPRTSACSHNPEICPLGWLVSPNLQCVHTSNRQCLTHMLWAQVTCGLRFFASLSTKHHFGIFLYHSAIPRYYRLPLLQIILHRFCRIWLIKLKLQGTYEADRVPQHVV